MKNALLAALLLAPTALYAQTPVRVGWCAPTLNTAIAPIAVAQKMGWFAEGGIKVDPVSLGGSIDCVKNVATKEVSYAIASIEPVVTLRAQGVKVVNYYTAYQGNIYGIAVPEGSPVNTVADLRGKRIGVTAMSSAGVMIARAMVANAGMNPDRDVRIVVAGQGAQVAALLRGNQVDALSLYDTSYALAENAGAKLRYLAENKTMERFPSNGLVALEDTLANKRSEAVALARGYAMGTVFTLANPEAAIRITYEVYPQLKPTGKDEATALAEDTRVIEARNKNWLLSAGGVTRWGESSEPNYDEYVDFLVKWNVVKQKVPAKELVTNALLPDIGKFDPAAITAQAKSYK